MRDQKPAQPTVRVARSATSGKFVTTVYPKHSLGKGGDGRSGVTEKAEQIRK